MKELIGAVVAILSLSASLAVPIIYSPLARSQSVNYLVNDGFESGSLNSIWQRDKSGSPGSGSYCCDHSVTITTEWANNGKFSYKSLLLPSDPLAANDAARAELPLPTKDFIAKNAENWIGFVVRYPEKGDHETFTSIFQLHQRPDGSGGGWVSPPFFLYSRNGELVLRRFGISTDGQDSKNQEWSLGPVVKNSPIQFAFHVKASPRSDGLMQAWRDGKLMVDYKGPTQADRTYGYSIRWGQYKGPGNRVNVSTALYFDDIKVTDGSGSLEAVSASSAVLNPNSTPTSAEVSPTGESAALVTSLSSSPSPSPSPAPVSTTASTNLRIEVENGVINPFEAKEDAQASRGKYVESKTTNTETPIPNAVYQFNVTKEGTYKLVGSTIAANIGSDSFFLRINNSQWITWNFIPLSSTWTVNEVKDLTLNLTPGLHTVELAPREAKTKLDYLELISTD